MKEIGVGPGPLWVFVKVHSLPCRVAPVTEASQGMEMTSHEKLLADVLYLIWPRGMMSDLLLS